MIVVLYNLILIVISALTGISVIYYVLNSYSSMKYSGVTHPENVDLSKVTIAMPVYNEDMDVFRESIASVAMQGCKFVVVGDSSDEPYHSIVERAGGKFVLQETRGGQKKAISRAFDFVDTEFVLLVDSDTILPPNAVASMQSYFDSTVGGVGANIGIKKTGSAVAYASEFIERSREVVFRAMSAHGNVMNLDGACVMLRTELVRPFIKSDEFLEFKLFGRPSVLGEDWLITGYIINKGYRAVKDYSTRVESYPQKDARKFLKQNVRWARSGWIRFGRELMDGTATRAGKFYTFELIYTYLLPVIVLGFGIFRFFAFFQANPGALHFMNIVDDILLIRPSDVGYLIYTKLTIIFANISGSMIFLGAVITRMKGEKLKTIAFGALGLLVLFVTNIYGIFTFWKGGNHWLTR